MGMYTEIIFGAKTKESLDENTIKILKFLFDSSVSPKDREKDFTIPNHPFFQTERWDWMMRSGGSCYFAVTNSPVFKYDDISHNYGISCRTNIKNYTGEIEAFLAWIKPYLEQGSGEREMFAIVIYEEDSEPTIYYLKEKDKV